MNVCIVSSEFLGPVKNTGIATVTTALARQLVADGHEVTLLYTYVGHGRPVSGDKPWTYWVEQWAAERVTLKYIPHEDNYRAWRNASWLVKDFLAEGSFDLVYFNDYYGSGYYSLLAKRAGIAPFSEQLHCIITHGSMEWVFDVNDYYATRLSDLEWMGLERRSVEMADVVIAPSSYLVRQYERYGWKLPDHTFHQPYPIAWRTATLPQGRIAPITELVFFGRLEPRKGLWLFCEAIDGLADRLRGIGVTFVGRAIDLAGISSALQIVNRSADWPLCVRLFTDFDRDQALSYLSGPGRLAVMPSTADNSPCAVYECMEAGIPLVTTRGSGIEELIDPRNWDAVTVQPTVDALREKLARIVEHGADLAKPGFDPAENLATWSAWHRFVADYSKRSSLMTISPKQRPKPHGGNDDALIFLVDNGRCTLSLLIENLTDQVRRFGDRASYLVLSTRPDEIHDVLRNIFGGLSDLATTSISILNRTAAAQAVQTICTSHFVFFIDAEAELSTSFFISALERLRDGQPRLVTCAVTVRQTSDQRGEIENLPTGGLPGLAVVGEPIGGSVWAVSAAKLAQEISSLRFYDPQLGALATSSVLGQFLMQRCRLKGVPVDLLPVSGAVETRQIALDEGSRTFDGTRRAAALLGLNSSTYAGGPAWIGASMFGAFDATRDPRPVPCSEFLASDHPFLQIRSDAETKAALPELAATLGSADLSVQLAASEESNPGRLSDLTQIAAHALRATPQWDFGPLFTRENIVALGSPSVSSSAIDHRNIRIPRGRRDPASSLGFESPGSDLGSEDTPPSFPKALGRIYVDATRLRIARRTIQTIANLRRETAKLYIIDVPLCGHTMLHMNLRSSGHSELLLVCIKLLDQQQGGEIGVASARLAAKAEAELSIPLHNLYAWATLALELSGAEKFDVTIENLRVC